MAVAGVYAQGTSIRGKVTAETGESLPGVTILQKGTTNGTTTDTEGNYALSLSSSSGTLVFSFIGYETKEVNFSANQTTLNIRLEADAKALEEVVVVGYGTQKKETVTGAVTSVKGAEVTKSPALNVANNLAGRLPGLTTVGSSGEPGYDGVRLRIRGVNTFGKADPLVVVDGVPGRSLERIDPNTIESISVLKDASAAIYGAQAANGVILITTKRGKTGKPTITASFNQGYGRPTRIPDMANAAEYATMLNEIDQYAGKAPRFQPADIQKFQDGSDPWGHPDTDWFREVLKPWSGQNQGNVSVSGGSEAMKYFVSLTSRTQDGFYFNSGTKYNQYDFRSNLDGNITKNISLGVDLSGRMEDRNFPTRSAGSIFRMVMRGKPNLPAYWPDGTPGPDIEYGDNPVVVSTKATGYDRDKRYVMNSNFKLNVQLPWVKGLSFTSNAAIDKGVRFNKTFQTPWYLYSWDGKTMDANGKPVLVKGKKGFEDPRLNQYMEDNLGILLNGLLNYERTFATDHGFKFLVGIERITNSGDNFNAFRRNFTSTAIDQLFAGAVDQFTSNTGSGYNRGRLNYFGRANYDFKAKYLAEFVWRYQASYIFEKSSRFGFFPGVSLGYVVSQENFWKNITPVNYFKLRASWGKTGFDEVSFEDVLQEYRYLTTYGLGGLAFVDNGGANFNPTLYENGVPNANTTWEKALQRNIGFDAELLDGKVSITADYFNNQRSDILWRRNASIPLSTGMQLPPENIGKTANRGFDFNIDYKNNINGDFTYSVGLNGGYAKNKIVFWDEAPGNPDYQLSTGRPIGSPLYYQAIGIFKDQAAVDAYPHWSGARPGDVIFEDVNKDSKIDANDRVRMPKSDIPTWTGGLNLNIGFKGFDFTALVQGAAGAARYITTESGEIGNFLQSFHDNRWTPENPNASGPRTFNRSNEYWMSQQNTFWFRKTDYVRLKNIEIGYSLPAFTQKWGIQRLRIYTNAYNLLTYSPDYKDFDPELGSGSGQGYPLQKIINGGLSVNF
ncbi:SusC/RagA family TonB-linked outer membrane protein [Adhaeribacter aerolatus]|uniref:SusC/RagA family TonB-linked outer membrane protein n=2 Tax=Adhaeribacter aerolatus TaxID=670289 RepID=A0A512B4W3_9BACT|nr:SusC/RagA family TonB-linked outer membrane protein [Adhaeribacter aerolatus]